MGIRDKYKGVMTVTLSFSAGSNPNVLIPDLAGVKNTLDNLFPPDKFSINDTIVVPGPPPVTYELSERGWVIQGTTTPAGDVEIPPNSIVTVTVLQDTKVVLDTIPDSDSSGVSFVSSCDIDGMEPEVAFPGGGNGSSTNPWQIVNLVQLGRISDCMSDNFILEENIVLTSNWTMIEVIGGDGRFEGTLNFNGKEITNSTSGNFLFYWIREESQLIGAPVSANNLKYYKYIGEAGSEEGPPVISEYESNCLDFYGYVDAAELIEGEIFSGGNGSSDDPWEIRKVDEFRFISGCQDDNFELMNTIEVTNSELPLVDTFAGSLNGNNNYININVTNTSGNMSSGIFNDLSGVTIKNLNIHHNGTFTLQNISYMGALSGGSSGYNGRNTVIDSVNCVSCYVISSGGTSVGGLIGVAVDTEIYNSSFSGEVSGGDEVGGLVGNASGVLIYDSGCETTNVYGTNYVGGIVGTASSIDLDNADFTGIVSEFNGGGAQSIGGIVGFLSDDWGDDSRGFYINGSDFTGKFSGFALDRGGLIGEYESGQLTISNLVVTINNNVEDPMVGVCAGIIGNSSYFPPTDNLTMSGVVWDDRTGMCNDCISGVDKITGCNPPA